MIGWFAILLGLFDCLSATGIVIARVGWQRPVEEFFNHAPLEEVQRVVAKMQMATLLFQLGAILVAAGR